MTPPQKSRSRSSAPQDTNQPTTTGHSWDGIEEYNNPLPRWWLWVFFASIAFAVGYAILYPSLPIFRGIRHWSSVNSLNAQLEAATRQHAGFEAQLTNLTPDQINTNPDLRTYAITSGRALFTLHCSQCHGAGGAGNKGFPNLLDDEWIHGGTLADIALTITHGVRYTADPQTRQPADMAAFGKDGTLTPAQIADLVKYLSVIAYNSKESPASTRGAQLFAENCVVCHGDGGVGNRELGAPPLNNPIWLYGGSPQARTETLTIGRAGVMPGFTSRLNQNQINKLTVYVHSLGGGEPTPVSATTPTSGTTVSATTVSGTLAPGATSA